MPTKYETLCKMAQHNAGRPLTEAEQIRIHHAMAEADCGRITARLAIGEIVGGVNEDWPSMTRKTAVDVFGLNGLTA
jgi:hypothetical protein